MKTTKIVAALHAVDAKAFFTKAALASLFAGAVLLAAPVKADAQVGFGFHVGVYAPAPAYYNPGPAYYAPQPVYEAPAYGYYQGNAYGRRDWDDDRRDWGRRDWDHRDWDRRERDDRHDDHRDDRRDDRR